MSIFPEIELTNTKLNDLLNDLFPDWGAVKTAFERIGWRFKARSNCGLPFYEVFDPDPVKLALSRIEIRRSEQHAGLLAIIALGHSIPRIAA